MSTPRCLKSLPRRVPFSTRGGQRSPPPLREKSEQAPAANVASTTLRSLQWLVVLLRFAVRVVWDRARGRGSARHWGIRLRQGFGEMGGTAIKVGQQLSIRIDLLPFDVCDELAGLMDSVPPFPVAYAIARAEAAAGRPIDDVYETFDPEPIGSASVACVYQAILHDGEKVAIKVRRPDVVHSFATDLRCLDWFTYVPEFLALVKPGFFKHLRNELRSMLLEELDFDKEARYQRLFRKLARRARLRWVTSNKVFRNLSSSDVLVSTFSSGVWCRELLAAVEDGDAEALARIKEMDIDPKKVARRLLQLKFWGTYEEIFFHGDPHPANIVIQPGSKIVMLDFGSCGFISRRGRLHHTMLLERLVANDVSGMAEVALQLLTPLPRIDVFELKKRIEAVYHEYLLAIRDKRSAWWERTTMGMWLALMRAARYYHLPVNQEVVRLFRASLLYDTLVCRLHPQTDLRREYRRYMRLSARRAVRRARKEINRVSPAERRNAVLQSLSEGASRLRYIAWQAELFVQDLPVLYNSVINKGSYTVTVILRLAFQSALLLAAAGMVIFAYKWLRGETAARGMSIPGFIWMETIRQPFVITGLVLLVLVAIRRAQLRLREFDVPSETKRMS